MPTADTDLASIPDTVAAVRATFDSGRTRSLVHGATTSST